MPAAAARSSSRGRGGNDTAGTPESLWLTLPLALGSRPGWQCLPHPEFPRGGPPRQRCWWPYVQWSPHPPEVRLHWVWRKAQEPRGGLAYGLALQVGVPAPFPMGFVSELHGVSMYSLSFQFGPWPLGKGFLRPRILVHCFHWPLKRPRKLCPFMETQQQLRKGISETGEVDYDEELDVGNTVIWNKGSKSQAMTFYKTFIDNSPAQQAANDWLTEYELFIWTKQFFTWDTSRPTERTTFPTTFSIH